MGTRRADGRGRQVDALARRRVASQTNLAVTIVLVGLARRPCGQRRIAGSVHALQPARTGKARAGLALLGELGAGARADTPEIRLTLRALRALAARRDGIRTDAADL